MTLAPHGTCGIPVVVLTLRRGVSKMGGEGMPSPQARGRPYMGERQMHDIISLQSRNGVWVMIIAVVAIGGWSKFREHELRIQQELRTKEMEHQQKMKELELELEKTKARQAT